jgi:hypothetical protein
MKHPLAIWALAGLVSVTSSSCIFVHVRGDLHDEFIDGDEGFPGLRSELEASLVEPVYELDIDGNLWRTEASWSIAFAEGSDGGSAFHKTREAVLARVAREGGRVVAESNDGPHAWSCEFRIDDEPGEASVELIENSNPGSHRPHELEVTWEESD